MALPVTPSMTKQQHGGGRKSLVVGVLFHVLIAVAACNRLAPPVVRDAVAARPDAQVPGLQMLGAVHTPGQDPQQHFAVATAHPLATAAAEAALRAGGSAVDAWVAASVMLTVVTPQSTGIGGGGFALVWQPDSKTVDAWDFRETAPATVVREDFLDPAGKPIPARSQRHGLAVGTPGYIAGLWALHQQHGRLPWRDLILPAAKAAEQGVAVTPQLAAAIGFSQSGLHPSAAALFAPDGKPLAAGQLLRWPKLAVTLTKIANEGQKAFYSGPIAADLARSTQAAGGKLTEADLVGYQPRKVRPLKGSFFGYEVLTMPQPSAGGAQVLAMGEFLQAWLANRPHRERTAVSNALIESMRRSFALRLAFAGDPTSPAETLDAAFPATARAALRESYQAGRASATAGLPKLAPPPTTPVGEGHDNTSHVSIVDGRGMVVTSTHTVNLLLGSGIVAHESGILLNNEMDDFSMSEDSSNAFGLAGSKANLVRAGARPVSSMSPILLLENGIPLLAVGSPGGTRIPTTVLQVLYWHLQAGDRLATAVAHLRLHHQAWPDVASVETGARADGVAAELTAAGHKVERRSPWCNVQAVRAHRLGDGRIQWEAASDPRGEGSAAAY
jgi:gamma-glutamyltranspeptidase/glutathione hydrolase